VTASIEELVLRIPGLAPWDAQRLVTDVVRRIRQGLPEDYPAVTLGRVDVRLTLPRGLGHELLAERIARAVLDRLRPGGAT
jgi:hypothetical protein